jgi:hypothetical protein
MTALLTADAVRPEGVKEYAPKHTPAPTMPPTTPAAQGMPPDEEVDGADDVEVDVDWKRSRCCRRARAERAAGAAERTSGLAGIMMAIGDVFEVCNWRRLGRKYFVGCVKGRKLRFELKLLESS